MAQLRQDLYPARQVYCAVVLDVHSRRVVGWSIDSSQTAALSHRSSTNSNKPESLQ
jgi:transposase InsO family protein